MFSVAIIIGIYSYLIFSIGLLGQLYKENIIFITLAFISIILIYYRNKFKYEFKIPNASVILILIFIQTVINLIGALAPELGFDALWYHLTLPKIFIENNSIFHIPGGLFYYSDMPKLGEMIYASSLSFGNEILAKSANFSFGVLILVSLYKISREFLNKKFALLSVLIFSSNLVFSWQVTTAYADLIRTFFELMAFWGFLNYQKTRETKWIVESAVMLGLAISTKLLSIGSIFIFLALILIVERKFTKNLLIYMTISLFIPLPYFIFSFLNTGNPIYPFFSQFYNVELSLTNPLDILHLPDPISPIYFIFFPLIILSFNKFSLEEKFIVYYSLLSLIIWYITQGTGGGRFILPYLPAFSLITIITVKYLSKNLQKISLFLIIFLGLITIIYRGVANYKYLPVLLGIQSKDKFLSQNLNFSFGDFYDTDSYFKNHIKPSDKILLFGFHNLYYINFPFIDSSYVKKGDEFNFIAVQNSFIPERFKFWNLIYSNNKTGVKLYSVGGQKWVY